MARPGLLDGVKAVSTSCCSNVLEKDGLVAIDPVGEPFDALEAQAVATGLKAMPRPSTETVHEVYQKGYKMGIESGLATGAGHPAVTTGGPKRPKTPDEGEEK